MPGLMPIKAMRELRKSAGEDDVIRLKAARFRNGEKVQFRNGPWKGWTGVFRQTVGQNRVLVLLQILGGEHALEFHHEDITKYEGGNGVGV